MQVVYNANKLSKLVNEKKKLQNWLDYYQLKLSRNPSKRPSKKVLHSSFSFLSFSFQHAIFSYPLTMSCEQTGFLGLWGNRVDAIDFYTSEIERLLKEVSST